LSTAARWDIFCSVVDHFGDIAVSWRLARQLHAEHGLAVRLFVDDLATFRRLWPGLDETADAQRILGVEVLRWHAGTRFDSVADVVVDAFGSRTPDAYLERMAARTRPPVWLNLEYLSAEDWIEDCHRLASPHPRLPLTRYFFFPGFTARTGGVLEERGLASLRAAFLADAAARTAALENWEATAPDPDAIVVSLFGYGGPAVGAVLQAWAAGDQSVCVLAPEGRVSPDIARFFDLPRVSRGARLRRGSLEVQVLPFRSQDDYDRLLWASDCNFVRGEDSFVRAQWAENPFVWSIYLQDGAAHWPKLHAFLDRYGAGLEPQALWNVREFWRPWNRGEPSPEILGAAWQRFWNLREELQAHNAGWAANLRANRDLATNLVRFAIERL